MTDILIEMLLVSIIMPCLNAERFLQDSIQSVLLQSYEHWELMVINDGSIDKSKDVILSFNDSRIRYFEQNQNGVSSARNVGLKNMRGDLFCFLDADDCLPRNSLAARIEIFQSNPAANFVDGKVLVYDADMKNIEDVYIPAFTGSPLKNLLRLNSDCFFGQTWMIRRDRDKQYRMNEALTHCEDILFYLELSRNRSLYAFTTSAVLNYRRHSASAMYGLDGLHQGYKQIYDIIRHWQENDWRSRLIFFVKVKKIMFLSYWVRGLYRSAFLALWV